MKKQIVIRTYPHGRYEKPTKDLKEALHDGYQVVMCNKFDIASMSTGNFLGMQGNEYILEKE